MALKCLRNGLAGPFSRQFDVPHRSWGKPHHLGCTVSSISKSNTGCEPAASSPIGSTLWLSHSSFMDKPRAFTGPDWTSVWLSAQRTKNLHSFWGCRMLPVSTSKATMDRSQQSLHTKQCCRYHHSFWSLSIHADF